jgi:hypothetical protein
MSRLVDWGKSAKERNDGKTTTDYIGRLGPIVAFTLWESTDGGTWTLTSHFIPSKLRNKTFRKVDDGKAACQKIVDDFARWLAGP